MNKLQFEAPEGTTLHLIRASSDVGISGWDRDAVEIVLDGDLEQCAVQQEGSVLTVESQVALSISVPAGAIVNLGEVRGDLMLRELSGPVSADDVSGELLIRSCSAPISLRSVRGDLTVDTLHGPLTAREVSGDARLNQLHGTAALGSVKGDVRVRTIGGDLKLGSVSGDVRVREAMGVVSLEDGSGDFKAGDLRAGMEVTRVKGDMSLKTVVTPGATYRGRAEGDIVARFPEETSARFTLEAKGTILAKLPQVDEEEQGRLVGRSGEGESLVELAAGGSLSLKIRGGADREAFGVDLGADIAAQIESQIAESLGAIDIDSLAQREIAKAMRLAEREIEKARERAERERDKIQERLQRAQERAARAAQRAQERVARSHRGAPSDRWVGMFGGDTFAMDFKRGEPKSQASKEEQLAILKMVQEGKITAEQAEKLLQALGG